MNFDDVITIVDESPLSDAGKEVIREIVVAAQARGSFSDEEKQQIMGILDFEQATRELEAEAYTEEIETLDEMLAGLDSSVEDALSELETIAKDTPQEDPPQGA